MEVIKVENRVITFGVWGGTALLINSVCSRIFLNFPRSVVESAGNAAWLEVLYLIIIMFLYFLIVIKLTSSFEGKDLLDIGEYLGGNAGRIFAGLPIVLLLLFVAPVILREYTEDMKIIALPTSPINFVMLFFVIPMIIGANLGLETIVRFHAIVVPIISVAFIIIMLGVSKYYDFSNFYPILGTGPARVFGDGFFTITSFGPILYIFFIGPFIKTNKNFKAIALLSLGISSFNLLVSVIVFVAVIPIKSGIELFLPFFQLARLINFGTFLQRVESIFMLCWATSAVMYLSNILFFIIYIFKKTFKLEYYKPLTIPFTVIIFCLSILPPNLMTAITLETKYYSKFGWGITLGLPMLVLIISNIKKKVSKGG
jgi:spore germination protein (amino acid permease)